MDLELQAVSRRFPGPVDVQALSDVSLTVHTGEFLAIVGPSGGGKSTLLNIIGLLDVPDAGVYRIDDADTASMSPALRARIRAERFGFVFQSFHLLDARPTIDSVELGMLYQPVPRDERVRRAREALAAVGLPHVAEQRASRLSGGQRQRVAVARALAAHATVVVADEPTGNLDSATGRRILDALLALRDRGCTIVLVTHDLDLAQDADRVVHVRDGRITAIDEIRAPLQPRRAQPEAGGAQPGEGGLQPGEGGPQPGDHRTRPRDGREHRDRRDRASRLRVGDAIRDAFRTLTARLGRTVGLVGAVATAVGLAVASIGIADSASAQVSDRFDAHANRDVSVTMSELTDADSGDAISVRDHGRALVRSGTRLAGVDAAAVTFARGSATVQATPTRPSVQAPALSVVGDIVGAARLRIAWAPNHPHRLSAGEILIGRSLARQLPLGSVAAGPIVDVGGSDVGVAGVIMGSPRDPAYLGSILTAGHDDPALEAPSKIVVLLRTTSGAAQQVARQSPAALDPTHADALTVDAPVDPSTLRSELEGDVRTTLFVFTAVAVLAAIVALGNAMVLAVMERRAEFGLRRAVGARPVHIAALIMCESLIVGAIGGAVGLVLGLGTVLGITLARQWVPVFDLWLAPAAVIGGAMVGCLGGLLAAGRATRIEPQEALRS